MKKLILTGLSTGKAKVFTQKIKEDGKIEKEESDDYVFKHASSLMPITINGRPSILVHKTDGLIDIRSISLEGKIAKEALCSGTLDTHFDSLRAFSMNGKSYIIGHDKKNYSFSIIRVNPISNTLSVTYNSTWNNFYTTLEIIQIKGKTFLYGHSESHNYFFVNVINSDGTLGKSICLDQLDFYYYTINNFCIEDRHYIYGCSMDNSFFIQRIMNDGSLGDIVSKGENQWWEDYRIMNHYFQDDKVFIYAYSELSFNVDIREVSAGGTLDGTHTINALEHSFEKLNTFEIGGNNFLYGQMRKNNNFSIRPIDVDGKIGSPIFSKDWGKYFDFLFPIVHPEKKRSSHWMESLSDELLLKDVCMPGTHDAGMYKLHDTLKTSIEVIGPVLNPINTIKELFSGDSKKEMILEVIENFALTQSESIRGQLEEGVRYFDLRPAYIKSLGLKVTELPFNDILINHGGIPGPSISTILNDVKDFMSKNSKETVILMFTHFDFGHQSKLKEKIKEKIKTEKKIIEKKNDAIALEGLQKELNTIKEDIVTLITKIAAEKENKVKDKSLDFVNRIERSIGPYLLDKQKVNEYFLNHPEQKRTLSNLPLSLLRGKVIVGIEMEYITQSDLDFYKITNWSFEEIWKYLNRSFDFDLIDSHNIYTGIPYSVRNKALLDDYSNNMVDKIEGFTIPTIDLLFEDDYANKEIYEEMRDDQLKKLSHFGSNQIFANNRTIRVDKNKNITTEVLNEINGDTLFSLDWTLTFSDKNPDKAWNEIKHILDIFDDNSKSDTLAKFLSWSNKRMAKIVNEKLINLEDESEKILALNPQGRKVNIISVDYVPLGIVELCLKITNLNAVN